MDFDKEELLKLLTELKENPNRPLTAEEISKLNILLTLTMFKTSKTDIFKL